MEDEGITAWNINLSGEKNQVSHWWIVENSTENVLKVNILIGSRR